MKIVFYIRAIFEESEMPIATAENKNIIKAAAKFTELSNISIKDYRTKLRNLQKEILQQISPHFIINNRTTNDTNWKTFSFAFCQPETYEKFLRLNDEDIIIPLDDDDWLLPNIVNINFEKNGLTCWNSFCLYRYGITHSKKNNILPDTLNEEQLQHSKILTASGYAISANVVKQTIKEQTNINTLNTLLQRHSRARECIRILKYQETVVEDYLSVYVRHAANVTLIQGLDDCNENAIDHFNKNIKCFKHTTILQHPIPTELECYRGYIKQLEEINSLI